MFELLSLTVFHFFTPTYQALSIYLPHKQTLVEEMFIQHFSRNYTQYEIIEMYTINTKYTHNNFQALTHYHTIPHFYALKICSCEKHCETTRNYF